MTFGDTQLMLSRPGAGVGRVFAWIAVVLVLPWPLGTLVAGRAAAQTPPFPAITLRQDVADLEFGIIVSGEFVPGKAIIDAETGTKTVSGGVFDFGGAHSRAKFVFCGQPGEFFDIFLPTVIQIVRDGGGGSLDISNMTSFPSSALDRRFGIDCTVTVFVGGTLKVPPARLSGTYRGVLDVTVEYTPP